MKKQLLILSFILINYTINTAFAQETLNNTTKHKWDIGAEISSPEEFTDPTFWLPANAGVSYNEKDNYAFSVGLFGAYHLHNDVFIRLRANVCNRNITVHSDDSREPLSVPASRDDTRKQSSGTLVFSVGKNIVEQKFIRACIGIELSTTFFGKFTEDYFANEMAGFGGDIQYTYLTYKAPGGYAIRLGPFVGGQFVFLKHFSVGPEISYAFQYYKTGGEASEHVIVVDINNSATIQDAIRNLSTTKEGMGFSKIKAVIRMSYSF